MFETFLGITLFIVSLFGIRLSYYQKTKGRQLPLVVVASILAGTTVLALGFSESSLSAWWRGRFKPDLKPGAKLQGVNLERQQLIGLDLTGANLSNSRLRGSTLFRSQLALANFKGADLREADLSGADLSRADLTGAYLQNANLRNALLTGAILKGAHLAGADLSKAKGLTLAQVCQARIDRDSKTIKTIPLPVFSLGSCPQAVNDGHNLQ